MEKLLTFIGFRTNTEDLFKISDIKFSDKIPHSDLIVIRPNGEVEALKNSADLLKEDPETDVLYRWQGKWRSDMFYFKAKDFAEKCSLIQR